jgi:hypothetical protein
VKFYFPDSQDQVDPSFNFLTEERSNARVRQRDDQYAHEALGDPPFDGILVSKTIVDGLPNFTGKYTVAQRHRLYRVGIREFFRLDRNSRNRLETMGDCGAFSYVNEEIPPFTPDDAIDFYSECGFDCGISVDHVIFGFEANNEGVDSEANSVWKFRQGLTLELASEFRRRCRSRKVAFEPIGVAQGWSPSSYTDSVKKLQQMGYRRIALGGMVPLKTTEILSCLATINSIRRGDTQLHLLGITRCEHMGTFQKFGVTSFDSTSPFRQSFKDDDDNYYMMDRNYTALRVPQVDGNPKLRKRIQAGHVELSEATRLERKCLTALRRYDAGELKMTPTLRAIRAYEDFCLDGSRRKDRALAYQKILEDQPWKKCKCRICRIAGIDVAIFRGSERNKRRGFHNLYVFKRRLGNELLRNP